ncbi:hypothetical protein V5799_004694 [Amblyomma americanum]|uniref:E3 ubiquitin-protein ligase n=1 Tax=Amblyomma americanum TaxID=6943 RepID=A0AAQ4D5E0_AMBAM
MEVEDTPGSSGGKSEGGGGRNAAAAAARRARIMAQMSAMQKNFIREYSDLFKEATEAEVASAAAPEAVRHTCILCREDEELSLSGRTLVLSVLVQRSTVLSKVQAEGRDPGFEAWLWGARQALEQAILLRREGPYQEDKLHPQLVPPPLKAVLESLPRDVAEHLSRLYACYEEPLRDSAKDGVEGTGGNGTQFPGTLSEMLKLFCQACYMCNYRKRLVMQLVFDIDRRRSTTINIKTTLEMLYGSWNEVRQSTIRNCFADAGFVLPAAKDEVQPDENLVELDKTWDRLAIPGIAFDDFVSADDNLAVAPELTDQEIVDRVVVPEDNSSSDSEGGSEQDEAPISSADAADMARRLKGYLEKLPTTKTAQVEKALLCMDTVENFILLSAVKSHQTKITSFFK